MNGKRKKLLLVFVVFLCIIATSFVYGKYAHTYRKTITLDISKPGYTVVFHSNNGSDNTVTQSFVYGISQNLRANTFSNGSKYFAGWNTEANGTGTKYNDKQNVNNFSSTNNDTINLYAQWAQGKAVVNGVYYSTLKAAVQAVPKDNTLTIVTLLADTSELINVAVGQNIEFDLQNHTITNYNVNPIIENNGHIKITNGTLSSNTTQGAINVNSGASLEMTGGSIIATGTKQAIYNNGGTVTISGDAYLSNTSSDRAAVQNQAGGTLIITGGTIVSNEYYGVESKGNLTIGVKDGISSHTSPSITGKKIGVFNTTNVNFYDGIVMGTNKAFNNEAKIVDKEEDYSLKKTTQVIGGTIYQVSHLYKGFNITFDPTGGTLSTDTKSVDDGEEIGIMPVPSKSGYIFAGWFTSDSGGEEILESSFVHGNDTYYAHWTSRDEILVAEYNGVQYHSLQAAVSAAPSNKTPATIKLLMNSREHVYVSANRNIIIDSQGYSLKNDGNQTLFENYGTLTINNGEISSNENFAVIDNYDKGHIIVTGGSIIGLGTRQAIYNNSGGLVEISGNAYLSSCASGRPNNTVMERGTIQNLAGGTVIITGGTIIGKVNQAISNQGSLTIGLKDGMINANSPVIRGNLFAIKTSDTFNYYDGILKGINGTYDGSITDTEDNATQVISSETIEYSVYTTVHLTN